MLFTPGSSGSRLARVLTTDADAFVFDLEDGVAANAKAQARGAIAKYLAELDFGGRDRIVRVNRVGSAEYEADMAGLPYGHFDTLLLPKVETAAQVQQADDRLALEEGKAGIPRGSVGLMVTLETPRGVLNALSVADASSRCNALFFGAGDYASSLSGTSPRLYLAPEALLWARSTIVAAATAAGCDAIDTPFFNVRDMEGTYADAVLCRNLGFSGKGVFHPSQIEPVHRALTPTPEDVIQAQRVVGALKGMADRGEGVGIVDGDFIAIDLLPRMRRILMVDAHAKKQSASSKPR
jgi:citrate lyase beta subunit